MRPEQRDQERSVGLTLAVDLFSVALLAVVAALSGSLTLLGDAVRAALMVALLCYHFTVMRRVHRGNLRGLEYGTEKAEHLATVLLAIGLFVSAGWLLGTVIDTVQGEREAAGPAAMALAAVAACANLAVNLFGWLVVRAARSVDDSESFRVQLGARRLMLLSSIALQVMLTGAVLSPDPLTGLIFDAAGALMVIALILLRALRMLQASLPVLLDAPAGDAVSEAVRDAVERVFGDGSVRSLRSRRTGRAAVVQVRFATPETDPAGSLPSISEAIEAELGPRFGRVELSLVPVAPAVGRWS